MAREWAAFGWGGSVPYHGTCPRGVLRSGNAFPNYADRYGRTWGPDLAGVHVADAVDCTTDPQASLADDNDAPPLAFDAAGYGWPDVETVEPRSHVAPTAGGCPCLAGAACAGLQHRRAERCANCGTRVDPARWPECGHCQRGVMLRRGAMGAAWLAEHVRQLRARDAERRAARNGGDDGA